MFKDGHKKGESRNIAGKEDGIKGNGQKVLPQTRETRVAEIRDHSDHPKEMTLTQVMMGRIMVEEEVTDQAPHGDQNALTLLTHK